MARSYVGSCLGSPAVTVDGTVTVSFSPSQGFLLRGVKICALDVGLTPTSILVTRLLCALRWLRVPWRERIGDGLHLWTWRSVSMALDSWLQTRAQRHALRQVFVTDVATTEEGSLWASTGLALPGALFVDGRAAMLHVGPCEHRIDVVLSGTSFGQRLLVCLMGVVPEAEYLDDPADELVELIGVPPGEQKRVNRETH